LSVTDAAKYAGCFVAISSLEERKLISGGKDPKQVLDEAERKGYELPILFFVPPKDITYIY